jgi:hypothetical protein
MTLIRKDQKPLQRRGTEAAEEAGRKARLAQIAQMNADQKQAQVAVPCFSDHQSLSVSSMFIIAGFCFSISAILAIMAIWQSLLVRGISVDQR